MEVTLGVFNKLNYNGNMFVIEKKEELIHLVNDVIEYGRNLILKPDSGSNKNFKELAVIDIKDIVSTISKFKITVNGEIGYKNLPVYTLTGIVNTDLLNIDCLTNTKSFGIRTVGKKYESKAYGSVIVPKKILCWNIII